MKVCKCFGDKGLNVLCTADDVESELFLKKLCHEIRFKYSKIH